MAYRTRSTFLLAAAAGLAAFSAADIPAAAVDITLTETGSTLLHPLFDIWAREYTRTHPGIRITAGATGSEAGQKQALSGQVLISASDAYMSDRQMQDHSSFVDVPLAISAQAIGYNLPGLNASHVRLSGPAPAGIYEGTIHEWDAPEIKAIIRTRACRIRPSSRCIEPTVQAAALRKVLLWSIEPSEDKDALLRKVHFVPLPPHIWELSQAQIQTIR